jgi:hypothetical protein
MLGEDIQPGSLRGRTIILYLNKLTRNSNVLPQLAGSIIPYVEAEITSAYWTTDVHWFGKGLSLHLELSLRFMEELEIKELVISSLEGQSPCLTFRNFHGRAIAPLKLKSVALR